MCYCTNGLFYPDLFKVYSYRWIAFTTATEPHLPQHGVGIAINAKLLAVLVKLDNRIVNVSFKGNPKTTVVA